MPKQEYRLSRKKTENQCLIIWEVIWEIPVKGLGVGFTMSRMSDPFGSDRGSDQFQGLAAAHHSINYQFAIHAGQSTAVRSGECQQIAVGHLRMAGEA